MARLVSSAERDLGNMEARGERNGKARENRADTRTLDMGNSMELTLDGRVRVAAEPLVVKLSRGQSPLHRTGGS